MSRSRVEVFPSGQFDFAPFSDGPGESRIASVVTDQQCDTLGGGVAEFSQTVVEWQLPYDELIYVIQGELIIGCDGVKHRARAGDVMLIHRGAAITYEAEDFAKVFYVLYPSDWRTRFAQ